MKQNLWNLPVEPHCALVQKIRIRKFKEDTRFCKPITFSVGNFGLSYGKSSKHGILEKIIASKKKLDT